MKRGSTAAQLESSCKYFEMAVLFSVSLGNCQRQQTDTFDLLEVGYVYGVSVGMLDPALR